MLLALLARAWNTLYSAHELALRGFHSQALNLLRTPIEDWMAYWYIRSFPDEHGKFTDASQTTPLFNDMLQRMESRHHLPQQTTVRDWLQRMHKFSHIDKAAVRMVMSRTSDGVRLGIGPTQSGQWFNYCAAEAVAQMVAFADALDSASQLMGCGPLPGRYEYVDRAKAWLKREAAGS